MGILRVREAFSVGSDPTGHVYTPGELVSDDNPYIKGREHLFESVEEHVYNRSDASVEAATAEPGSRRTRSTKKRAAKKAAAKKADAPADPPADAEVLDSADHDDDDGQADGQADAGDHEGEQS